MLEGSEEDWNGCGRVIILLDHLHNHTSRFARCSQRRPTSCCGPPPPPPPAPWTLSRWRRRVYHPSAVYGPSLSSSPRQRRWRRMPLNAPRRLRQRGSRDRHRRLLRLNRSNRSLCQYNPRPRPRCASHPQRRLLRPAARPDPTVLRPPFLPC